MFQSTGKDTPRKAADMKRVRLAAALVHRAGVSRVVESVLTLGVPYRQPTKYFRQVPGQGLIER
jgi:hypothetical protein